MNMMNFSNKFVFCSYVSVHFYSKVRLLARVVTDEGSD